jgi:6-pyruvoyl tetrahydropterin synthase/QueD family protein
MTAGAPFQVRVEGIRFEAAHFATFGGACEPLHGHSYEVAAEIEGALTEDSWVMDFGRVKAALRKLCAELDHRFVLQLQSRVLSIQAQGQAWHIQTPDGRSYVFPVQDVAALEIDNSTAERLAQYIAGRLWSAVSERGAEGISAVAVEVWEGPGQRASFRQTGMSIA